MPGILGDGGLCSGGIHKQVWGLNVDCTLEELFTCFLSCWLDKPHFQVSSSPVFVACSTRAGGTGTASAAMAVLVFEGEKWHHLNSNQTRVFMQDQPAKCGQAWLMCAIFSVACFLMMATFKFQHSRVWKNFSCETVVSGSLVSIGFTSCSNYK